MSKIKEALEELEWLQHENITLKNELESANNRIATLIQERIEAVHHVGTTTTDGKDKDASTAPELGAGGVLQWIRKWIY